VDEITDITWISRKNYMTLKIYTRGIPMNFFHYIAIYIIYSIIPKQIALYTSKKGVFKHAEA